MEKFETKVIETHIEKHTIEESLGVWCDLCGRHNKPGKTLSGKIVSPGESWGSYSDIEDVVIEYKTGVSYPEGGYDTTYKFDVCPSCFKEKLIPWFENQGGVVTKIEAEY